MISFVINFLFLAGPVVLAVLFIESLCCYISAKMKNKKEPGKISDAKIFGYKITMIITGAVLGVIIAIVIGLMVLLSNAVVYM